MGSLLSVLADMLNLLEMILRALVEFTLNNFWSIFLIVILLKTDSLFYAGVFSIMTIVIYGYIPIWWMLGIVVIVMIAEFIQPKRFWKRYYERKYERLRDKYHKYLPGVEIEEED